MAPMSEYQFYEFRAVDRPLTPEEQRAVARLSSRVAPHPYRAVFIYNWSSLPAVAEDLVARYYDAMLYTANWGSRQLIFRFPSHLVDPDTLATYNVCTDTTSSRVVTTKVAGEYVLLNLQLHDQNGFGWLEPEGLLDQLLPLRDAVMLGDYRLLYLTWLAGLRLEWRLATGALEPQVPSGLRALKPALEAFVDWVQLDADLLDVAGAASPDRPGARPADELSAAIAGMPITEKDDLLLRLATGEPNLTFVLNRRLAAEVDAPDANKPRRTVADLLACADRHRMQREADQAAQAEMRRIAELEALSTRQNILWAEVDRLIQTRQPGSYNQAVELLVKLHAVAEHEDTLWDFEAHITQLTNRYRRLWGLLNRMRDAGVLHTAS